MLWKVRLGQVCDGDVLRLALDYLKCIYFGHISQNVAETFRMNETTFAQRDSVVAASINTVETSIYTHDIRTIDGQVADSVSN